MLEACFINLEKKDGLENGCNKKTYKTGRGKFKKNNGKMQFISQRMKILIKNQKINNIVLIYSQFSKTYSWFNTETCIINSSSCLLMENIKCLKVINPG